jgi:hypothetical protein
MNMNTPPPLHPRRLCTLLALSLAHAAQAQVAPSTPAPAAPAAAQETIVLNPFVVTTEAETG